MAESRLLESIAQGGRIRFANRDPTTIGVMKISLTLKQKAFILVGLPLTFQILFISYLFHLLNETELEVKRQWHSRAVVDCCNGIMTDVYQSRANFQSRRFPGPAQIRYIEDHIVPSLLARVEKLLELVKDKPAEKQAAEALMSVCHEDIQTLQDLKRNIMEDPLDSRAYIKDSRARLSLTVSKVDETIGFILESERRINAESPLIQATIREQSRRTLWFAVSVSVFLACALAAYFNRGSAQRLKLVVENTRRMEEGLPFHPPLLGADEIAAVDDALRRAASGVEAARRKERFLLDNMPVAILSIDEEGTVQSANPAAEELFDKDADELLRTNIRDLVAIDSDACLIPGSVKEFRVNLPSRDLWVELLVREFESLRLLAMIDISERLAIQRLRSQFVAMVSHDLRTPLTSVQASLELIATGSFGQLSDDGNKQLDRAEKSLERLIRLINDLLDSERIESGTFVVDKRWVSLSTIIERALESVRAIAADAGITIQNKASDLSCFADEDRIIQVLVNLLGNAIKFSPSGSTVLIETQTTRDAVKIRVIDRGRGVPLAMLPSIFQKFMQVEKSDSRRGQGFGLGLSICKSIVEQHGGKIGVYSEEGEGSTFWFSLPFQKLP